MARTPLTVHQLSLDGVRVDDAAQANADGHSIPNTGSGTVLLYVINGGGSPIGVTFKTNHTVAGIALPDEEQTLTNGQSKLYAPFPKTPFNQDTGEIYVDFPDGVTDVDCKAFKVG